MNRNAVIAIIVGVLILLVVIFAMLGPSKEEAVEYEGNIWVETYSATDKDPYGTYVIRSLLKREYPVFFDIDQKLQDELPGEPDDTGNVYVFIGERQFLNIKESSHLNDFINRGNTAFIAVEKPFSYTVYSHFEEEDWWTFTDSVVTLSFYHGDLDLKYSLTYRQNFEPVIRDWHHINEEGVFTPTDVVKISKAEDGRLVCIEVPYGDGRIIFHTIPLAFTNISMLDSTGLEYAERVLSHLPHDRPLYWDELTKYPPVDEYTEDDASRFHPDKSPLQFILANPALKWSYYLLWITILLYIFFRGKREQRAIPPVEVDANTTIHFINTIADLYFRQNKHQKLVAQKKRIFLDHIRTHYYLSVGKIDDKFKERLAMKSGVDEEQIYLIFDKFEKLNNNKVSERELIELHQMIEAFYKNSQ